MATIEKCPYSNRCGGCDYQGVPYKEQLAIKQKTVRTLLGGFGKVEPILAAEHPEYYRNKVHGVFDRDRKGNVYTGIYEENSHRIVPVRGCMIEDQKATAILQTLSEMARQFKIHIYDEDRGTGLLRHALIRTAASTGEIMVVLVITDPIFPSKNNFVKELRRRHPEVMTVVLNINDRPTSMVLGERNIVLYGKGFIEDVLCGLRFRLSPSAFYQVNSEQTAVLYKQAIDAAALTGTERVIDAYCGIGTIKNARFVCADAGDFMVNMAEGETADVVILDPPRSGSTAAFIESVNKLRPAKVVYVSCDPNTLKRDLELFKKSRWKIRRIQPVDMFPYTKHVETVVTMTSAGK